MINEHEYNEFVFSVKEFTLTVMDLFTKYKGLATTHNDELKRHLSIITVQQGIIKQQNKILDGYKALILEHEQRIAKLEARLDAGPTHKIEKLSTKPH